MDGSNAISARDEESRRLEGIGRLAGGVAHDFNNLLGVILNYAALLSRRLSEPSVVADLGQITAAAERAAVLTRQLLTFAGRDILDVQPVDLDATLRGMTAELQHTLGEQVDLRLELHGEGRAVLADRGQLEQAVRNVVVNAREAIAERGTVTITTARSVAHDDGARGLRLKVVDTGRGMSPDLASRAFEPFFTTKAPGHGTGLGLSTVYGMVQRLGGAITFESELGHGTTVTIWLPSADDVAGLPAAPPVAARPDRPRILLVEDEPALRIGTERLLVEQGYDVIVASDGVEALDLFEQQDGAIDVVLTDVSMPRMRGDELARRIALRRPSPPVVLMSGYDEGAASRGRRVLLKPLAIDDLLRTLRDVLGS